jgi:hypothetical protein
MNILRMSGNSIINKARKQALFFHEVMVDLRRGPLNNRSGASKPGPEAGALWQIQRKATKT